jgi:ActR/RegA family two-component response regulator
VSAQETAAEQEAFEVNQRLALICVDDDDRKAEVSAAVQELGYRPHIGGSPPEVLERLRKNAYEIVVVDESYEGSSPHDHPVLNALQWMPMTTRRYMFVALLGGDVKTLDNMMAFAKSVNLVVHYNDVPQIKAALQRAVADNDQFYRVFRQVLQEAGKR